MQGHTRIHLGGSAGAVAAIAQSVVHTFTLRSGRMTAVCPRTHVKL